MNRQKAIEGARTPLAVAATTICILLLWATFGSGQHSALAERRAAVVSEAPEKVQYAALEKIEDTTPWEIQRPEFEPRGLEFVGAYHHKSPVGSDLDRVRMDWVEIRDQYEINLSLEQANHTFVLDESIGEVEAHRLEDGSTATVQTIKRSDGSSSVLAAWSSDELHLIAGLTHSHLTPSSEYVIPEAGRDELLRFANSVISDR